MKKWIDAVRRFAQSEEGVSAIEYALLAALIAVVIIAGVTALGKGASTTFSSVARQL